MPRIIPHQKLLKGSRPPHRARNNNPSASSSGAQLTHELTEDMDEELLDGPGSRFIGESEIEAEELEERVQD